MELSKQDDINERLKKLEEKMNTLDLKLDKILDLLQGDIIENCEKMGNHINFVERIYDNVKRPLGYICNKVKYFSKGKNYSLEYDKDKKIEI
jgi:archaellum component FlaC